MVRKQGVGDRAVDESHGIPLLRANGQGRFCKQTCPGMIRSWPIIRSLSALYGRCLFVSSC